MKIAIIGGGNGGYAAAADLTNNGHEIYFWQRSKVSSKALYIIVLKIAAIISGLSRP